MRYAWHHEQNFRLQIYVAVAVLLISAFFQLSILRWIIIIMLITMVLVLELLNTFFEKMIDVIQPRIHEYAAIMKDVLAASVLIASVGALVVGIMVFWPYL